MFLSPVPQQRQTEQVTAPQERRVTGIRPSAPSLQHLYVWPVNYRLQKYVFADDLAIMHVDGDWQVVEGVLSKDMATVGEYLQTWKLKLSTT